MVYSLYPNRIHFLLQEPKCSNILANIQEMAKKKVVLNSFSNEPPAVRKALRMENRRKTREKLVRYSSLNMPKKLFFHLF